MNSCSLPEWKRTVGGGGCLSGGGGREPARGRRTGTPWSRIAVYARQLSQDTLKSSPHGRCPSLSPCTPLAAPASGGWRRRRVKWGLNPLDTLEEVDHLFCSAAEHVFEARVRAPASAASRLVSRADKSRCSTPSCSPHFKHLSSLASANQNRVSRVMMEAPVRSAVRG